MDFQKRIDGGIEKRYDMRHINTAMRCSAKRQMKIRQTLEVR